MSLLPINHLIDRNDFILDSSTLWVNPPNDPELARLIPNHHMIINTNWVAHQAFNKHITSFGLPSNLHDESTESFDQVVLYWPKAKAFSGYLLQYLQTFAADKPVYVLAENDGGGKSLNKQLKNHGDLIEKLDIARRCTLWKFQISGLETEVSWPQYQQEQTTEFSYKELSFKTLPGVFGAGKLDKGTELLLNTLPIRKHGRTLDIGCGSGIIGLYCKQQYPELNVELCDVDAMAIESTQLNAQELGLEVEIFSSDGLANCRARFHQIICNPPFHQGLKTDYQFAQRLLLQAKQHLTPKGELWIVANNHLGYEQWAKEFKWKYDIKAQENGFKVIKLTCH